MNYKKIKLLFNTVRYLRFEQVFYRVYYKCKSPKLKVILPGLVSHRFWSWKGPVINEQSIFSNTKVKFLSLEGEIEGGHSWNDSRYEKLWLYNLHYFDDLNAIGYHQRVDIHNNLIQRWIDENPPCVGNGWEPYPTSLRIVNWVKWLSKSNKVKQSVLISLIHQADVLSQQLEYHILGNHLFANSKALIFIGCFLEGDDSHRFLKIGLQILDRELKEQFLDDGGHFELSPMYHIILLWDLLELIDLARTSDSAELRAVEPMMKETARKAIRWLQSMVHPDGDIAFFNDSAIGIAAEPIQVYDYAKELGVYEHVTFEPVYTNVQSGYSRISSENFTCIFDHGRVGPDYLPGHAHADTLSFELSFGSSRLFVNSGTSLYGVSEERLRQRSSPAHNVLVVNNENSSEVWSGFRVALRANAKVLNNANSDNLSTVTACHDGYLRLKDKIIHKRTIDVSRNETVIRDTLNNSPKHGEVHYHLHPDVEIEHVDGMLVLCMLDGIKVSLHCKDKYIISSATWHPRFGVSTPSSKIIFTLSSCEHTLKVKVIEL